MRDQISTMNEFLYTYVQCLLFNGYSDDDITSSEYLFGMYYYYKTKDPILLYNITTEQHYDTNNFYQKLEYEVWAEDNYFNRHFLNTMNLTKAFRKMYPQSVWSRRMSVKNMKTRSLKKPAITFTQCL